VDLGIRGKSALVCGASRGLGKACALALAREGVNLTIVARTRDLLERAGAEIAQATGTKVGAVAADLTTPAGRAAALGACAAPDILVNNSQGPLPGNFRDWSRDDWIAALDDMMLGPIEMMRLTVDGMSARGFGRIVNIVSRSVKVPQAELGLSKSLLPARGTRKQRHATVFARKHFEDQATVAKRALVQHISARQLHTMHRAAHSNPSCCSARASSAQSSRTLTQSVR